MNNSFIIKNVSSPPSWLPYVVKVILCDVIRFSTPDLQIGYNINKIIVITNKGVNKRIKIHFFTHEYTSPGTTENITGGKTFT